MAAMKNSSLVSCLLLLSSFLVHTEGWCFGPSLSVPRRQLQRRTSASLPLLAASTESGEDLDLGTIKMKLTEYLERRKELNADELAKKNIGKVLGGTKGNKVLEFVSGAPNKAFAIEDAPNALDYDELTKYGYGYLVTPIMKAGGRLVMYQLMDMQPPPVKAKPVLKDTKIVMDRTGENDSARYKGLKMGQALDDAAQAEALFQAQRKQKAGQELRPKLMEETYVQPFADKRNVGPKQEAYTYTVEQLDELARSQGKAAVWAVTARRDKLVKDRLESLDLGLSQRVYGITTALLVVTAYGKSTPTFLTEFLGLPAGSGSDLLSTLQIPALTLLLASIGSTVVCGMQAKGKRRSQFVWAFKGLMGGPVSVLHVRSSSKLVTLGELEDRQR